MGKFNTLVRNDIITIINPINIIFASLGYSYGIKKDFWERFIIMKKKIIFVSNVATAAPI